MAPKALIGCLKSLGIDWMAITDHNTLANCPAYAAVAERKGSSFTWVWKYRPLKKYICWCILTSQTRRRHLDELYESLLPLPNDPDFLGIK